MKEVTVENRLKKQIEWHAKRTSQKFLSSVFQASLKAFSIMC